MPGLLKLALCQMNPTVGDIAGNEEKIIDGIESALRAGAQLVLFPEMAITGYPPEDLLLKEHFLRDAREALERVAAKAEGIVALVGFPERADDVYNACAVLAEGSVQGVYRKMLLPNYGVFDEHRYFQTGTQGALLEIGDVTLGLTICEDIWEPGPPASDEALAGATVLVNISASPYHAGKGPERERMLIQRARDNLAAVAFCALVGGQDELVFDGHSLVVDHQGTVIARAAQFEEELLIATIDPEGPRAMRLRDPRHRPAVRRARPEVSRIGPVALPAGDEGGSVGGSAAELLETDDEVYAALMLGLHDYVEKNGFGRVVLGLSGGIDSALVACIAADTLGPDRVSTVIMPSPYSSPATQEDARRFAANLGAETLELPIESAMHAYQETLADILRGRPPGITQENLQARIRGNLLMALSNEFGWLVLTTGNKSEMSVGYTTLYGDAAGGFAVIKDCSKTRVYELARHRNRLSDPPTIPVSIIDRAPSAELRHDQRDDDSLPPYSVLDPILDGYIENDLGREQLILRGFDPADVDRVITLVDRAEYKRRQAPPGIKISVKAFGRDRRVPITNRYGG